MDKNVKMGKNFNDIKNTNSIMVSKPSAGFQSSK